MRPLEFDSALEDDFRLRISVFEALRDLSRSRVSCWLFVSMEISFSISSTAAACSWASACFRWLVLIRVRFRDIRVYASLRWFLRTPVTSELSISAAVRSSHSRALPQPTTESLAQTLRQLLLTIVWLREVMFWGQCWCLTSGVEPHQDLWSLVFGPSLQGLFSNKTW